MSTDTITIIANLALALSFVVGLIFGIAQVRAASRDRRERLTLETIRNFQTREFAEGLYFLTNMPAPRTREEFQSRPMEEQVIFVQFSQQMEHLGILVADGFVDIDLVDKTLGSFVTSQWEKNKDAIEDMRVKIPDPYLAEYFQWLAEHLAKRMDEKPRKPVFETLPK
jgi:hypothetical protein